MKPRIFTLLAIFTLTVFSCAQEPKKDPVTDSNYFLGKISKLADSLIKKAVRHPRRAAIMDFVNTNGKTSQFGKYVTSKFTEISVEKNLFATPSEGEVTKTLKLLNLIYNGSIDGASAKKLGEALNCDAIIVGTISDLQKGSDVDLVLKIIDSKTGNVVSASSASFFRSKQVSSMLDTF
jgi:hypothetical protein